MRQVLPQRNWFLNVMWQNKMKLPCILTALCFVLTACSNQFLPKTLNYQKPYHLAAQQELGTMARFVYLPQGETLSDWQSAVEIFFDRNLQSLEQRLQLRQRVYAEQGIENVDLRLEQNSLIGVVIYPPSEKYANWQMDLLQGKNIAGCGFVQYQYSLKFAPHIALSAVQKQMTSQLANFKQQQWQWRCYK